MWVDEKDAGRQLTILIGGLQNPQVGRPRDPPGRVLHVVALPVDGPVLVGEAEGGLDVGAHVGEHGLLDRDPLHLTPDLGGVQSKPNVRCQYVVSEPMI